MILTTTQHGLPEGPTHLAQMARNHERLDHWRLKKAAIQMVRLGLDKRTANVLLRGAIDARSGNTPTGSHAADFAARPESWAALLTWALGLGIGLWLLAWLWIAWEIRQVPEPETRCFENHVSGEAVCREQRAWEVE